MIKLAKQISEMKLLIEDEFKNVIFDVDIDTEELLFNLNKQEPTNQELIDKINKNRTKIFDKITLIKNEISNRINNQKESNIHEKRLCLSEILSQFCTYLRSSIKNRYLNRD